MSEESEFPTINFDYNKLKSFFTGEFQKLSDCVMFAIAASNKLEEKEFLELLQKQIPRFARYKNEPFPTIEKIKPEFVDWCIKNSLRDCDELISTFFDHCWHWCNVFSSVTNGQLKTEEYNALVEKTKSEFHMESIVRKYYALKNDYGVSSGLEKNFTSLNKLRNCIVHRHGIVSKKDFNENDTLVVWLRYSEFYFMNPDNGAEITVRELPATCQEGWSLNVRGKEFEKKFLLEEKIKLSLEELSYCIQTFSFFVIDMADSLSKKINSINNKKS